MLDTEWQSRPLRDCAKWYSGGTPSREASHYWGGNIPWISAKSLKEFFVNDSDDKVTKEGAENGTRLVPENTVLFIVRGMSLKTEFRIGITTRPVTFNQDLKALVAHKDISPHYLAYAIKGQTPEILGMVGEAGHGTGVLPTDRIEGLSIGVPPLPEQRAIAHILSTLDNKIELNCKMNETLEAMARALFQSWFVDFDPVRKKQAGQATGLPPEIDALFPGEFEDSALGQIPKGWRIQTIEEVSERIAMGPFGSSIKVETFQESGIPVISGQHLKGTALDDNTYNFVSAEHADKLKKANVQRGDVVFTHAGNIGQVAFIPTTSKYDRYVISQRQFYLRPKEGGVPSLFFVYYFKSSEGQHRLLANTSSSGVPSIAQPVTYLRSIDLPIPNQSLLNGFEAQVSLLQLRIGSSKQTIGTLTSLRDTLLPKLISGELRVKDAERFVRGVL